MLTEAAARGLQGLLLLALALPCLAAPGVKQAVPGGVYVWHGPANIENPRFEGKPVMRLGDTLLVGLSMQTSPGVAEIHYEHDAQSRVHQFTVQDKTYTEQHLSITNQAMVDPPPETMQRIQSEAALQRRLYQQYSAPADLSRGFIVPLIGPTTSLFGHRRFFNGLPRSPHSGLDIAADTGTPVKAAGNGRVTLAQSLYFNGKTLFVDHGQGLITMYCHLSELLVDVGAQVLQGQSIGQVGATGRVTGPHLHWSVSLNGYRVDPSIFMQALNAEISSSPALSGDE